MSATLCVSSSAMVQPLLCLHDDNAPQRGELEEFIHARYLANYQANIGHFLPFLLATWQGPQLQGALGLRPGASGAFFVENYLDTSIESIVAQQLGVYVPREQVIETGNLAGSRGSSQLLFVVLTEVLYKAGFRWITFTATPLVISLLHRLGFAPQAVCEADVSRLGEHAKDWGTYYDNKPSVVIGNIEQAHQTLQSNELALKLLQEYRAQIDAIVSAMTIANKDESHG
jgi:hypothetical protein